MIIDKADSANESIREEAHAAEAQDLLLNDLGVIDETPEYPISAPMKPDDPERRSEQSMAETAGIVEEEQLALEPAAIQKHVQSCFLLAVGSAFLIGLSLAAALSPLTRRR